MILHYTILAQPDHDAEIARNLRNRMQRIMTR